MSCLQGTVHRTESAYDDDLWACHYQGQLAEAEQSQWVCAPCFLLPLWLMYLQTRQMPILSHRIFTSRRPAHIFLEIALLICIAWTCTIEDVHLIAHDDCRFKYTLNESGLPVTL